MLHCELHCHSIFSKDSLMRLDALLKSCKEKGIDRVAITDHNTIAGGLHGREMSPEMVIVGEEIMTTGGELLAYYVTEEIPAGLSPLETIDRLHAQNAVISVAHPFDRYRRGAWDTETLASIVPFVDALETFNARCIQAEDNHLAIDFAASHNKPGLAGSDAHTTCELGRATVWLPDFLDANSLRQALQDVRQEARLSPPWIHFSSRWAKWVKSWHSQ